jgi:dienelactone hydrolase
MPTSDSDSVATRQTVWRQANRTADLDPASSRDVKEMRSIRNVLQNPIWLVACAACFVPLVGATNAPVTGTLPDRVTFASADGHTTLVGYVFMPPGPSATSMPGIVMMHGRAGAYSSLAKGRYDAATLSRRHQEWGHLWAQEGYVAVLVDGFGPRGYPQGFGRLSYEQRPEELNEVTVRPLDAYGALAYLRTRRDVISDRVALQGWSNGGSATLAAMSVTAPGIVSPQPATGFRGGLAFYPACGLKGQFDNGLVPYGPVRVLQGAADEEVSPRRCAALVERSRAQGGDITFVLYPGATHDFDDPGTNRRSVRANAAAADDAITRAKTFFASVLKQ